MKHSYLFTILFAFSMNNTWTLPAFSGAQGWGTDTPGGRGGKVIIVSNLNSSGPGSFSEAMLTPEPRIIVFQVSGVIVDPDITGLAEEHSYVTVAGQTSPGGITLKQTHGTTMQSYKEGFHDAVFRFIRFRGDGNYDNISFNEVHNIVVDHCDFSGASDEAFDITYSHHFTVSWSTIANSGEGQTYGMLLAYPPTSHISLHHNFFAHHVTRGGPHMHWENEGPPDNGLIDYRNNVAYNSETCRFLPIDKCGSTVQWNVVGNYFKAGPDTEEDCSGETAPVNLRDCAEVYEADNFWIQKNGESSTDVLDLRYSEPLIVDEPFPTPEVTTLPVQESLIAVLSRVGVWPRDPMNTRTVGEFNAGTGQLRKIDDPLIESGDEPFADADKDGMPDVWEDEMGFDSEDGEDYNLDHDADGYTNIEEYINDQANALVGIPLENNVNSGIISIKSFKGSSPELIFPSSYSSNSGNLVIRLKAQNVDGIINIYNAKGHKIFQLKAESKVELSGKTKKLQSGKYWVEWLSPQFPYSIKKSLTIL